MAVTSGFFNSLYGDRKYNAEQFSALFDNLITDGVFSNVGNAFQVTADGSNVLIDVGRAWFNSVWVYNDTTYPLAVLTSEVLLDRIDAVVIEINHTEAIRAGRIFFVQGTASSDPQRPTLVSTNEIHQYPLAYVYRKAGATTITQADVTNMIGTSSCPYVTGILATQNIDKVVAQWEAQFDQWFDDLQVVLDGDVAANLASQIIELDGRFEELARTGCVYEDLQDSDNDTILDSQGRVIEGSTSFRQRSEDPTSGTGASGDVSNLKMEVVALNGRVDATNSRVEQVNSNLSPKVGDILVTSRSNPGSGYVLCNGASVSRSSYPSLSSLIGANPRGPWAQVSRNSPQVGVAYGNGYFVTLRYVYQSDDPPTIQYSTNGTSWTEKTVTPTSDAASYDLRRIRFVNGYFVICGMYRYDDHEYSYISYTTNPSGTWTHKVIESCSAYSWHHSGVYDITYGEGLYVLCGSSGNTGIADYEDPIIAYASSLGGSWTIVNLSDANLISDYNYENGYVDSIAYYNGNFYASSVLGVIYSADGISWSLSSSKRGTAVHNLIVVEGKLIITGRDDSGDYMYVASSINATWTPVYGFYEHLRDFSLDSDYGSFSFTFNRIAYVNSYYFVCGGDYLHFAKSLDGPWDYVRPFGNGRNTVPISDIAYAANSFVVVSEELSMIARIDSTKMLLPSNSFDDASYVYIKAK